MSSFARRRLKTFLKAIQKWFAYFWCYCSIKVAVKNFTIYSTLVIVWHTYNVYRLGYASMEKSNLSCYFWKLSNYQNLHNNLHIIVPSISCQLLIARNIFEKKIILSVSKLFWWFNKFGIFPIEQHWFWFAYIFENAPIFTQAIAQDLKGFLKKVLLKDSLCLAEIHNFWLPSYE